ncbi:helix-turn-helix domain-containing protein [Streptomyces sp. HP-A2021]|nr:helix-turn-helix domain-containing protein [Streptomyces sp. HP-A2021]UOB15888.1 helix-turn-helix domain-containing protein [Streptomyces sp. HP-A2021]
MTEHRLRVRAQAVLHAAHGRSNACLARETGLRLDTVRRWRGRFAQAVSRPKYAGSARCRPRVCRCVSAYLCDEVRLDGDVLPEFVPEPHPVPRGGSRTGAARASGTGTPPAKGDPAP